MEWPMKSFSRIPLILLASILVVSCAKKKEEAAPPAPAGGATHAKVSQAMLQRWMVGLINRQPSPNAESSVTIGSGVMQVKTPGESKAWGETADVDSNGTPETIRFMWDGQAKVMYAHTQDWVKLSDGTVADKGLLVAQFGEGNTRNKVPGSGWYAYALTRDTTATGVTGTLFGCTFDKYGAEGECGTGTFSRDDNEFHIEVVGQ
jgi:hypothetical protein